MTTVSANAIPAFKSATEIVWIVENINITLLPRTGQWLYELVFWNSETQDWDGRNVDLTEAKKLCEGEWPKEFLS